MVSVQDLREQHKVACDKIIQRLETKSSRGEGPNRVLRKILKHYDRSDGQLFLTADEFVQAMERVGTKLTPSDIDLLLTVYAVDGTGFDGNRFAADLFGEGGHSSSQVVESGIAGGVFSQEAETERYAQQETARTERDTPQHKKQSNDSSVPGGIFGMAPEPSHQRKSTKNNVSSIPGGIFG
ncbi:hypothetical protein T492DRAFT_929584 [Pavlovales sp. CCMP2436]|nr:hypothetical protein T492DRAFT_929584 [Pavlovales sp. CCMP2436]